MPFKANANHNFPPDDPDVEIRFRGLLLLTPVLRQAGPDTNCLVSILRADGHSRKIRVFDKGISLKDPLPTPTGRAITTPLTITSTNTGVTKFVSTPVATPFAGNENDHPRDFRWSVDLKALHVASLPSSNPVHVDLGITLTDGLLFSAIRTNPAHHAVMLRYPSGQRKHWNRIAAELGANCYLAAAQSVTLQWTDQGIPRTWMLTKGGGSGDGYLIRIENLPDDESEHDDFALYYNSIVLGTGESPNHLDFYRRIGPEGGSGVDAPCMSGSHDGDGRT